MILLADSEGPDQTARMLLLKDKFSHGAIQTIVLLMWSFVSHFSFSVPRGENKV